MKKVTCLRNPSIVMYKKDLELSSKS